MPIPEIDPLDERYRWCIYCKADCWPDPEYQDHEDDCPTVTGVYPIDEEDMACCRCERPLTTTYRLIEIDADLPLYEVVCEDCALGDLADG